MLPKSDDAVPFRSAAMLSSIAPPFLVRTEGTSVTCLVARNSSCITSSWSCIEFRAWAIGGRPWAPLARLKSAMWK